MARRGGQRRNLRRDGSGARAGTPRRRRLGGRRQDRHKGAGATQPSIVDGGASGGEQGAGEGRQMEGSAQVPVEARTTSRVGWRSTPGVRSPSTAAKRRFTAALPICCRFRSTVVKGGLLS